MRGGARKADEEARDAVLRELREEIGLTGHGAVVSAGEIEEHPDFRLDISSLFVIRDVEYAPKWSLEVEAVREAALDALPADMSPRTLRWMAALRPLIEGEGGGA